MPNYLYKCAKCEHKQVVDHPMMNEPTIICPDCSIPMNKLPGVGAVSFRGSGWGSDRA